jgi:hypothetical protein
MRANQTGGFPYRIGDSFEVDADVTVSEDGKTLTVAAVAEGGVKTIWVFDRVK